jgi:hypothetical protein
MLEFGPTYELAKSIITSKLNSAGTDLEDDADRVLLAGTRFTVFDCDEWHPYSDTLKCRGANPHFYAIHLEDASLCPSEYLVLAHRLEQDSQRVKKHSSVQS